MHNATLWALWYLWLLAIPALLIGAFIRDKAASRYARRQVSRRRHFR